MFRPRNLIWLAIVGGIGYLAWRWRQSQVAAHPIPATSSSTRATAAPSATTGASADAPPSGPRRIATRVHRGAPPAMPIAAPPAAPATAAEEPPAAPTEPPAVAEQTLAPISAEEVLGAPAEHEPPAAHEQTLAPVSAEEIPAPEQAPDSAKAAPAEVVNINTAELQTLIDLPGIGRSRATRIIAYREQHGPFASVDALVDVQGIGPDNINKFRHLITV